MAAAPPPPPPPPRFAFTQGTSPNGVEAGNSRWKKYQAATAAAAAVPFPRQMAPIAPINPNAARLLAAPPPPVLSRQNAMPFPVAAAPVAAAPVAAKLPKISGGRRKHKTRHNKKQRKQRQYRRTRKY